METFFEGKESILLFTKHGPRIGIDKNVIQKEIENEKHLNRNGEDHTYVTTSIGVFEDFYKKNLNKLGLGYISSLDEISLSGQQKPWIQRNKKDS